MKTIVVGGHGRNVGKTSLVAAIISAWPQCSWTAVKISSHWHSGKESSGCTGAEEICRIEEELDRDSVKDTGRYLAAGASRSFWVRIRDGRLEEALPQMMPVLRYSQHAIIESNGIVRYIRPDLYLMVLRYDVGEYKDSAIETLPQAHAVVAVNNKETTPVWDGAPYDLPSGIRVFNTKDLQTLPPDLKEFIKLHLD